MKFLLKIGIFSLVLFGACKSDTKKEVTPPSINTEKPVVEKIPRVKVPRINEDSVYNFVKKQLSFGPRVPGSKAHSACKSWLKSTFESYGAEVIMQDFEANIYTGDVFPSTNIIAQINPSNPDRIVLAAHWDSRMMGENDKNESKRTHPIDGADDGASGVGVLLEVARILKSHHIYMGVDFILFDAEDQGSRDHNSNDTWCIGSQYWSKNLHATNYKPLFGILLDMVGAKNATFFKEAFSNKYAPVIQRKIWSLARKMNSGKMFIDLPGGGIMDDHYYVNTVANIPMVDIIHTSRTTENGFPNHWHTHNDNINIIDKTTLRKVTQLVTAVTYKTSDNSL